MANIKSNSGNPMFPNIFFFEEVFDMEI
jgi:hypothetical protein